MKNRVIVRAVIQRGDEVLVNVTRKGPRLIGGRVKPRESMTEALEREVLEEVGLRITVRDPVLVREKMRKSVRELTVVFRVHVFGDIDAIEPEKGIKPRWLPRGQVVGWTRPAVFLEAS